MAAQRFSYHLDLPVQLAEAPGVVEQGLQRRFVDPDAGGCGTDGFSATLAFPDQSQQSSRTRQPDDLSRAGHAAPGSGLCVELPLAQLDRQTEVGPPGESGRCLDSHIKRAADLRVD